MITFDRKNMEVIRMKWQDKLDKDDRQHLKDTGIRSLKQLRATRKWQAEKGVTCVQCRLIAIRTGVE